MFAHCIDARSAKSDIALAMHIVGGIDDRSSRDEYCFLRHLRSLWICPRLLTGHCPTVIVILNGVSTCETRRPSAGYDCDAVARVGTLDSTDVSQSSPRRMIEVHRRRLSGDRPGSQTLAKGLM